MVPSALADDVMSWSPWHLMTSALPLLPLFREQFLWLMWVWETWVSPPHAMLDGAKCISYGDGGHDEFGREDASLLLASKEKKGREDGTEWQARSELGEVFLGESE